MNALKHLFPYIARYKGRLVWGIVAITISNVFSTLIPKVIGPTINNLSAGSDKGQLVRAFLYLIGLSAGSGLFLYLTRQTIIVLSRLVEYDLRNDFMRVVQALPMNYFTRTPTGDVMALATNDISAIREFCGPALMYAANAITTFLFAMTMMLLLSPKITLLALLPLPLVSYTVFRIGKKVHGLYTQVQKQYADLTSLAQEAISGVRVIRSYVREWQSTEQFGDMSLDYKAKNIKLARVQTLMIPLMTSLIGLSLLIVLAVGGMEVKAGSSTVGDITQFFMYISLLIWPVIAVGWVATLVQRASASMKRLNLVMTLPQEVGRTAVIGRDQPFITNGTPLPALRGRLRFQNVSFRYQPDLPDVLRDISFTIDPGQVLAIVGSTGSGKSTIVDLIARLYEPTGGRILIDDIPLTEIPVEHLRQVLGVVTQETFLFSDTIEGNIRFGLTRHPFSQVEEASRIARLYDNVQDFPNGFQTIVGERGITLSGGQKQRTSIARAVFRQPVIMILDDALSAVDTETEEQILSRLKTVMRQRTSILIAHRISTVKDADKILVLQSGRIAETGTHQELVEAGGLYAGMYQRQLLESQLAQM